MFWNNPFLNPGLPDGVAKRKGITAADVDPWELARGTEHELEHTTSRRIARQIALDHRRRSALLCEAREDGAEVMAMFWENPILNLNPRWTKKYKDSLPDSAFLYPMPD